MEYCLKLWQKLKQQNSNEWINVPRGQNCITLLKQYAKRKESQSLNLWHGSSLEGNQVQLDKVLESTQIDNKNLK